MILYAAMTLLTLLAASLLAAAAPERTPAPSLDGARAWLNAAATVSLQTLRGKVALVYFADDWSAAGRRTTLAVQRLEAAFPKALVAVGVRAPRPGRPAETPESLRVLVLRREIAHPIADDGAGALAARWSPRAPVDLFFLDARGRLAGRFANDSKYAELLAAATKLIEEARADKSLRETSVEPALERDRAPASGALMFPTALAYDAAARRLHVADTGRNRLVSLALDGSKPKAVGHGAVDFRDGTSGEAGFDHPEALAVEAGSLYAGDTHNDAVRRVDAAGRVHTLLEDPVRWPRGLAIVDGWLYAADGETRGLWAMKLPSGKPFRYAGSGRAGNADGALAAARFQEPAGLAWLGGALWVADAEAGTLRRIDASSAVVTTPALRGPGFPFSRPEALAVLDGALLIADSGDGALKRLDPASGEVAVLARGLSQPSGLAVTPEGIVVAETGRSRLLKFSKDGAPAGELAPSGLPPAPKGPPLAFLPPRKEIATRPAPVRAGAEQSVELGLSLPPGMKLNPRGPFWYRISETSGAVSFPGARKGYLMKPAFPAVLRFTPPEGRSEAVLDVDFYYCRADGKGLCFSSSQRFRLAFDGQKDAPPAIVKVTAKAD